MERIKLATHQCLFGQEKWILKNIENCYDFVDKIYLAYSNKPWNYNTHARDNFSNVLDLNIILNSRFNDKIKIIYGEWDNEQDQRNACVNEAIKDGFEYLMILDADEFYLEKDYIKIIDFISENNNYDVYKSGWISFWKNKDLVVVDANMNDIIGYPQIVINLKKNIKFSDRRNPNSNHSIIIPETICYHMSFVLTDEECFTKLSTWGHSHEFNFNHWYQNIWLNWEENKTGLHPINPNAWYKTIKNNRELPKELKDGI